MTALGYALGVLIGVTLGLLGGGGAILSVPILVYILAVPVKSAVPTSLVVVGLTSLVGMVRHYRAGHVNARAEAADRAEDFSRRIRTATTLAEK